MSKRAFLEQKWGALRAPVGLAGLVMALYHLPADTPRLQGALLQGVGLLHDYAREHILLCVVPALLIAGLLSVRMDPAFVHRHLGAGARPWGALAIASVSGALLAVCSCTILPLFTGIWTLGAGLGPAIAFLYSGPAINVMAVMLTARVLGPTLGISRALGAVFFAFILGAIMARLFRKQEQERPRRTVAIVEGSTTPYGLFVLSIGVLVAANFPTPALPMWGGLSLKWLLTALMAGAFAWRLQVQALASGRVLLGTATLVALLALGNVGALWNLGPDFPFLVGVVGVLCAAGARADGREWLDASWGFAKQLVPLLLVGVLIAGLLFGRGGAEGLVPGAWIASWVGGNSLMANLAVAVVSAFMYIATLTEVPILQGLLAHGMGNGPSLTLLLAGPALSLPNILVINRVLGGKKTTTYVALVIVLSAVAGTLYGHFVP